MEIKEIKHSDALTFKKFYLILILIPIHSHDLLVLFTKSCRTTITCISCFFFMTDKTTISSCFCCCRHSLLSDT